MVIITSAKKKLLKVLLVAVFILIGGKIALSQVYVSGTWRYKIIVEVETPEGLKTGSSVWEISNSSLKFGVDWPNAANSASVSGEAVVVDLGDRGAFFALISGATSTLYQTFPVEGPTTLEGIKHYKKISKPGARASVDISNYPQLVAFKDLTDPSSVKSIQTEDEFTKFFDEDINLRSISIEIVDERPQPMISAYLPWLSDINGSYLSGKNINGLHLYEQLHSGEFKR